ncbi:MAG: hypothetical protein ACI8QZ_002163 [Chlamydiales bacterium]|jgi:hypothetical protein
MSATREFLTPLVEAHLDARAGAEFRLQVEEIAAGVSNTRFAALLSRASRFAPRIGLAPDQADRARAQELLGGWDPERWRVLEAWRVLLVLVRPDLETQEVVTALEEAFQYADEGEARALYRVLAHMPQSGRFLGRAEEGCRTNIVPVFEAIACDTPFAFLHFGDLAWHQLALKAVFIGAPLWRVHGLDERLSPELARMALDLVDERRSAGRDVQHELWLCLGAHAGDRGLAAMKIELLCERPLSRRAAALALGRAGVTEPVEEALAAEKDGATRTTMEAALAGEVGQRQFELLEVSGA